MDGLGRLSHNQHQGKIMKNYSFRQGARVSVSAQIAGTELDRIRKSNDGKLMPADIVHESKPKAAPLHNEFEWNNTKAADLWRRDQARYVVSTIRVEYEQTKPVEKMIKTRAFTSVETDKGGRVFIATEEAISDDELRHQILYRAYKQLITARREIIEIGGLVEIIENINSVISMVNDRLKTTEELHAS